jgi:hypothetical protein
MPAAPYAARLLHGFRIVVILAAFKVAQTAADGNRQPATGSRANVTAMTSGE